ncbi:MAG: phosphatidate cytidylyltransferase, partial [Thermomicrobium sp.]
MRQRTLSATLVVAVTLVPLVLGTWAWFVLILAVLAQSARELARGFSRVTREPIQPLSIVLAATLLLITVQFSDSRAVILSAVISTSLLPIAWHARTADHHDGLQRGVLASFAAFYLGAPLSAAILLRSFEGTGHTPWLQHLAAFLGTERTTLGLAWLAWALSVTWLTDTFAYLAGSRYGRRKLAPRLSPGKTWEGAIAGFLTGLIVG